MEVNVRALQARAPESESLRRYGEIGRLVTGDTQAGAREAVAWTRDLVSALGIPKLRAYGIQSEHTPELVEKAARASSTKGNPIELTAAELAEILAATL